MIPHEFPMTEISFWGWVCWFVGAREKLICCACESNEFEVVWGEGNELRALLLKSKRRSRKRKDRIHQGWALHGEMAK